MKIKATNKLPRKCMIPGKITIEDYRSLQKGNSAEVDQVSADYLIGRGFAEAVKEDKTKTAKTGKGGDS